LSRNVSVLMSAGARVKGALVGPPGEGAAVTGRGLTTLSTVHVFPSWFAQCPVVVSKSVWNLHSSFPIKPKTWRLGLESKVYVNSCWG